ncbi:MAG: alpha/beta hydrolase [bacterium]|nr:alpha/beta hydrolase [bacterium]
MTIETDVHINTPVRQMGEPLDKAKAALVMIHGRGATAESMLSLINDIGTEGFAYLAPQAAGNTWYPYPFMSPIEANEPALSSALNKIERVIAQVAAAGIPAEKTVLIGFSQGACLTLEYAARHAERYGGIIGLSGGLIGPVGTPRDYPGSLAGTPVFLGCSDVDSHIPLQRVHESTEVLQQLGGSVTERIYPGMGHTVNQDEIDFVRQLLAEIVR